MVQSLHLGFTTCPLHSGLQRSLLSGFHGASLPTPPSMLPTWQPEWCSWHTGQIQNTVQLPIFRRNLSYSNCSLQLLHPGHCCCCDLLFCHCFLPSSTHSSCAVASCVLFSPSILTFFPWKGFFSWCLFNSFKPSSHLHQTRIPGPLSEVLFFPPSFQSLSCFVSQDYETKWALSTNSWNMSI